MRKLFYIIFGLFILLKIIILYYLLKGVHETQTISQGYGTAVVGIWEPLAYRLPLRHIMTTQMQRCV
jgi:hypothetical protein